MEKILVLAGPSAVGKTTVMKEILRRYPIFEYVRSATTRAPRGDGYDEEYLYLSENDFFARVGRGEMLEYTEFGGNYYGTPSSEIERIFNKGKNPILILDIKGVKSLKDISDYSVYAVYITAEMETLDKRLRERAYADGFSDKAMETLERRKKQNRFDLQHIESVSHLFDLITVNENVSACADTVIEFFER